MENPACKILIADNDIEYATALKRTIETELGIRETRLTDSLHDTFNYIIDYNPPIAVISHRLDGLYTSPTIHNLKQARKNAIITTKFLVCLPYYDPDAVIKSLNTWADDYFIRSTYISDLKRKIFYFMKDCQNKTPVKKDDSLEQAVGQMLKDMGAPLNAKGYSYMIDGILIGIEHPDKLKFVTKGFYQEIAKKYDVKPTKVERAIRHAIEVIWKKGNTGISGISYDIRPTKSKPSNSEFLQKISNSFRSRNFT